MDFFHRVKRKPIWILTFTGLCSIFFFVSCNSGSVTSGENGTVADSTVQLVKSVCTRCHDFIPADMLDKKTWKEMVIPAMATKMGVYQLDGVEFRTDARDPDVPKGIYPEKPQITNNQLREIIHYFDMLAPDQLPLQKRELQIGKQTSRFRPVFPNLPPTDPPMTTYVSIRPDWKRIVVGVGGQHNRIGCFNEKAEPIWVQALASPPAYVDFQSPQNWLITCMGSLMPSNKKEGKLVSLQTSPNGPPGNLRDILTGLPRPVQINQMDLDGKGAQDVLIHGFGHLTGKFYWMEGGNEKNSHTLRETPGAIRSVFIDWDGDGKKDIITLFAQNKEAIVLFRNKGNGEYEEKELIKFLPIYGSTFFDVRDVNGDGKPDIIYCAGDNADFSVALKNFHGVYIYVQENEKLVQKYFYPIHGCYKALMRDFDLDGDQDMIAISFFADYISQWNESLVYFENTGNFNFVPYSVEGFDKGRWLTMDAGDVDGDGDEDVITGNFAYGPESFIDQKQIKGFSEQPVFMLLQNTTK